MSFSHLKSLAAAALIGIAGLGASPDRAEAGLDPFLGEIMMVGYNFCPRGWANADGQLLPINQNQALFSLYGTMYGGDGRTTFALPDLRGRVPIHAGAGPGLSDYRQGAKGGSESNTLTVPQLPPHSHSLNASSAAASTPSPGGNLMAATGRDSTYAPGRASAALDRSAIGSTGGGQPVNNMQPYQVIRYCVAVQGIFPARN